MCSSETSPNCFCLSFFHYLSIMTEQNTVSFFSAPLGIHALCNSTDANTILTYVLSYFCVLLSTGAEADRPIGRAWAAALGPLRRAPLGRQSGPIEHH
jgi:hypothetical protein